MLKVSKKSTTQVLCVGLALLLISLPAFSQLNFGQISGVLTDSSGSVIPNATVTVTDVARGVSRTLTTDNAGAYSAPSLEPGTYTVRAQAGGFNTTERQGIAVGVGQEIRIDFSLQPGQQTQTVVVTGTPPIINTTSAMISTTIESKAVNDLPLSGRLYTKLLDYQPGVAGKPGGNTPTYSSNGAGTMTNMWMLDGVDDVNQFAASGPLFGATTSGDELTVLPLDSIQEVNIIANPHAEFGWEQGAVVNVGLKSGTNDLHGSAYAFGRYTGWDATSPYLNVGTPLPKAIDEFRQVGASIGGHIIKDKLFYFGNYEGFRYTIGSPQVLSIPSSLPIPGGDPANSFPDALAALNARGVQPSRLSLNLAGCTAQGSCDPTKGVFTNGSPNPNVSRGIGGSNPYDGKSDNQIEKIDYHVSEKSNISGEYLLGNATDITAGAGLQPYWANTDHNRVMVVRGVWVYVPNSNLVNEARFGYDRYNLQDYNTECARNIGQPDYATQFGFVSGVPKTPLICGFPIISIGGYFGLGGFTPTGASQPIQDQLIFQNTYHFVDSVSHNHGDHQMKFGAEFHHTLYAGYGTPSGFPSFVDGNIRFGGGAAFSNSTPLEDFLAGNPAGAGVLLNPVQTTAAFNRYGGFFQDDWRITRKLTLNLGLRYEYESPVVDAHNAFGNFDPSTPSGLVQQTGGNALYSSSKRDFGPRLGFAWDMTGKGTTVIRAGVGIAYDTMPMDNLVTFTGANLPGIPTGFTLYNADGTTRPGPAGGNIQSGVVYPQVAWAINTPVFNTSTSALTCGDGIGTNPGPCRLLAKSKDAPRSYMTTWTFGIQHAFTNNLSLNAAYVGNHVNELGEYVNVNQAKPGPTDPVSEQINRPYYSKFPYFGDILQYSNVGYSNYHALQLNLVERSSHGLTAAVAYTLAHAWTTQAGESDNFPALKDSTNVNSSYAPMNSTPRHHLGITVTYDIPGKKGFGEMLEGWSVNSAVNILSGVGVDLVDGTDFGYGTTYPGSYWNLYGKADDFSKVFGRTTPIPYFSGASLPQACISAANSEPTNPSVPGSSGLASLQSYGCYEVGKSVIVPPALGTNGNMYRNEINGAPFREWNFSIAKEWKIREKFNAQFRAEAFNVTNSRNYGAAAGAPGTPFNFGVSIAPVTQGNSVNGTGDARRIQMGLRLFF